MVVFLIIRRISESQSKILVVDHYGIMGTQTLIVILATLAATTVIDAAITGWTLPPITGNAIVDGNAGSLPEDTATGATSITIVAITDETTVTTITYALTGQTPANTFTISTAGVVSLDVALDLAAQASHVLIVVATDNGGGLGTATATITVTNVAPAFGAASYSETVCDEAAAGTTALTAAATDASGTTITYALGTGNTGIDFEITSAGVIKVATGKTLDAATTAIYTIEATAGDATLTSTVIVTITVSTTCGTAVFTASLVTIFVTLVVSFQ